MLQYIGWRYSLFLYENISNVNHWVRINESYLILKKLITPKEIFTGSDEKVVGDKLKASIREKDGNYRADIASVLLTRLINYALLYAEVNPIEPKHINRLIYLINEPEIFTDDLKYHLVKKIINGNKTKFQKLLINPEVQNYITK